MKNRQNRIPRDKMTAALGVAVLIILTALLAAAAGMMKPSVSVINQNEQEPAAILAETKNRQAINPEYLGKLRFNSGLIEEPVVQGSDNEKYLNVSWDLKPDTQGTVFLDYRNQLEDRNLILYGHYVYKDESKKFGPLHQLTNPEVAEKNRELTLDLGLEIRCYQVELVYYYEMDNPVLEYFHTKYDADYFSVYLEQVRKRALYDSEENLTSEDSLLTLQTCVRNRDDLRLIVIARQID